MDNNCEIIVYQKDGENIKEHKFDFDDYRVAIAICNLLCNIENVRTSYYELKGVLQNHDNMH